MSVLWVLPVAMMAVGMVAVATAARRAAEAARELGEGCTALADVSRELVALRTDAGAVRFSAARVSDPHPGDIPRITDR